MNDDADQPDPSPSDSQAPRAIVGVILGLAILGGSPFAA